MRNNFHSKFAFVLASTLALLLIACNSGGSSISNPSNLAGNWTLTATSTQGHGSFSGSTAVSQTGVGLGTNGTTTLSATPGHISVSQTGTALTGTITYGLLAYNFTGTLSGSSFTATGSSPICPGVTITTSITGTVTSNSAQGTYTVTRGLNCSYGYPYSDAGTFTATKK
jgi:hypothetical protein